MANNVSQERLKTLIDRLERMEEEKSQIQEGLSDVLKEAKGEGFDIKTIKRILQLRKMRREKIEEEDALLETYRQILGI